MKITPVRWQSGLCAGQRFITASMWMDMSMTDGELTTGRITWEWG